MRRPMAARRIAQTVSSPRLWFATLVAAVFCAVLFVHADDSPEHQWNHWIKIFEALGPLVRLAVGWVFGKEVHRKAADDARRDADKGRELFGAVRQALRTHDKVGDMTGDETAARSPGGAASSRPPHLDSLDEVANELFPG
jgi:hypothetical protein